MHKTESLCTPMIYIDEGKFAFWLETPILLGLTGCIKKKKREEGEKGPARPKTERGSRQNLLGHLLSSFFAKRSLSNH
jgi:hypothetical protein